VQRGFQRLKMTVGHHGLQRRDEPRPLADVIAEDVQRIRAVREAVGPDVQIFIDANCSLDYFHASCRWRSASRSYGITFFEEPVAQNDIPNLVKLRGKTRIPLAAGQNEGLASRFRDMLVAQAVDVVQPNACITGGYTQCLRIAGMAAAFNTSSPTAAPGRTTTCTCTRAGQRLAGGIPLGGGRMLQAGVRRPARTEQGVLALPDAPGLGFTPNRERIAELARRPGSRGVGKA
jgi:L-rhamnonate dehydratase